MTSEVDVHHCWQDVQALCTGHPEVPVVCDWEISTEEDKVLSHDDAKAYALKHLEETGHHVSVTVQDYYTPAEK